MKKINRYLASLILISFFTFVSCEKGDLEEEPVTTEVKDDIDLAGVKPDAVSETREFGKRIKDIDLQKRTSTLTATTPWKRIYKNEVRAVGIVDNQVFRTVENEYFSNYSPSGPYNQYLGITSVSLGPYNSQKYGATNYWSSVTNPAAPEYRFYGSGIVSQNTGFSLWKRVPSVNAQVHPNYWDDTQQIGGDLWITTGKSISHQFTVEASASVTAGGKISIPFVAEGEASATVTLGTAYTYTNENSFQENFYFPLVNVPRGKSVRYQLEERWVPVKTEWKFPIQFKGNYVVGVEVGAGESGSMTEKHKVNVSAFNDNYNQPSKYHTMDVTEHLSHEFRVAAYIID